MRKRWHSSLRLRVLATTIAASLLLLGLTGVILMRLAASSIVEAKRQSAVNEALGAHSFMQQRLRGAELRSLAVSEALDRLADETGAQTSQFRLVIQAPTSTLVSAGMASESVPRVLQDRIAEREGLFITPTLIRVVSPVPSEEPGLAIGTTLTTVGGERVPIYYLFPMSSEQQVLDFICYAVIITFVLLAAGLTLIVYLAGWQAVEPMRRASATALRLASGDLDERLPVKGADEVATLADSMNKMAGELQSRISQLESLSAVQRRFVSDVSHELRTPLTTIRMASEMLFESRDEADPVARRSIELLASEIDRFEVLLSDLLEISRFDAGAAVANYDDIDFAELVTDEVAAHRPLASRQGVELRLEIRSKDTHAELDGRRIRRVLRNLLSNAIDHGAGHPVDITVAADEATVAVVVRDYGVGFEPSLAARLFDRFWRADPSRTRVVGGTGLGLSIAMEDTKLHRGTLTAWGRPWKGAQFRLTLPRGPENKVLVSPLPVAPIERSGA
ncbi:MtrAB system histidine kinase MtrB [Tessaracoccus sp. OH4464_COT-324]|uniref:MtrAB system histidine kinase MtrB n=1 Tax=Tessaracoccus sp. OH4464_COT-324 TaxID=2491059 RepID=UPI000F644853|nr:MtrAB system histidine kinase MtrB [Tessaracoccus sp. OH4464_COT-324]RRD47427.1 sensor histidine kinase [Tessaracoccus sp. OH4464_COT-324]